METDMPEAADPRYRIPHLLGEVKRRAFLKGSCSIRHGGSRDATRRSPTPTTRHSWPTRRSSTSTTHTGHRPRGVFSASRRQPSMRRLGLPAARPAPLPLPDAFASHQGQSAKRRNSTGQCARLGGLIAHADFQNAPSGRPFAVPMFVVTIDADTPVKRMAALAKDVLSGPEPDLVVPRRAGGASGRRTARTQSRSPGTGHRARLPPPRAWALDEFPASPSRVQHQPEYNSIPPSDCPKNQVSHACTFTNMSVYSGLWTDPVECSVAWLRSGWLTAFAPSCMPLCMGSGVRGRHGRRGHRGSRGQLWRNG